MLGWMMNDVTPATKQLAMQAFGTGARYGLLLPYSRKHETEADEIGLMLMARAGYDPSEAPLFWGRFAQAGSSNTPEWRLHIQRRSAGNRAHGETPHCSFALRKQPLSFWQGRNACLRTVLELWRRITSAVLQLTAHPID